MTHPRLPADERADHYPECRAVQERPVDRGPCNCAYIASENDDYFAEPPDMANRENGVIN